jgi:hypothetical protein
MRNPFRRPARRGAATYTASVPHPFQDARDVSLPAFASGSGGSRAGQAITPIATTSAFERTTGCAVPGCGRLPDDAIHAPED